MTLGTKGKLKELNKFQKLDGSVQAKYDEVYNEYEEAKEIYKESKSNYKEAQEKFEQAQENYFNSSLLDFKTGKQYKNSKKALKKAKNRYKKDREKYKEKLKVLRSMRREIRTQWKLNRESINFFENIQDAQKEGIEIPKYLMDEYYNQKNIYLSEKYTIDKDGNRTRLTPPNKEYSQQLSSLINENRMKKITDKVSDIVKPKDKNKDDAR